MDAPPLKCIVSTVTINASEVPDQSIQELNASTKEFTNWKLFSYFPDLNVRNNVHKSEIERSSAVN